MWRRASQHISFDGLCSPCGCDNLEWRGSYILKLIIFSYVFFIIIQMIYFFYFQEHPELKLSSHVRKVKKFGRPSPEIEGLVVVTGLSPLITCSLDIGERGLVSTFAERWHKETSSFQLSVGEDTITLDDVTLLLHLTITGAFHNFEALHVDDVVFLLVELLGVPKRQEMRRYNTTTQNPHVHFS